MARIEIDRSGETFTCEDDTILRAALRAGIGFPYACNSGSCGNCRFTLIEGEVEHGFGKAAGWSERDIRRNRWLGCQAIPRGDCRIKLRLDDQYRPAIRPAKTGALLESVREITHDIREYDLRLDRAMDALAGQYALVDLPGMTQPRAYSMSAIGEGGALWSFQIKLMPGGAGSSVLAGLSHGARLSLDGPFGTAHLRPEAPRDILCVAGGSGLSPMLAICRAAVADPRCGARNITLYYGARGMADLFDTAILPHEADGTPKLRFVPALSESAPEGWTGRRGMLHEVVEADLGADLARHEVYFAGPPAMAEAMERMLYQRGVAPEQMHFDKFL
ncbi:2Fe-2S iron-sulfur cluster-binding protein [Alkalilacustris brevis]|uniref:2Fe-2S iron-sulfur cluster-binding protein n=1 Tax=Alkalilacustris brevis TaxID=2026338 RepID=UPI000E0D93DC|nr:2Fe-2S iron-sulfur cluster binding domain-containing protein [Alkalilacustris brevis]